jgi:signal transduction histidine kinase
MAVQGYCSLLLDGQLGALNAEQQKVLERMQRSVKRLSRLTAGMFQMSVGPHTPRRPPRGAGDIQACITQAVHEVAPVLDSKQIEIGLQVTPPRARLQIDEMQMEQVLVNLLDNASRFTPRGGRIEIRSYSDFWDRRYPNMTEGCEHPDRRGVESRQQNAYRVEVRDSGPGVAPGDLERIFEEYTSDSSGSDRSRAGLGLAICRQIVGAHLGFIFAEPSAQGATFVFVLPYVETASSSGAAEAPPELVSANAGRQ